jgi:hypothetical protein
MAIIYTLFHYCHMRIRLNLIQIWLLLVAMLFASKNIHAQGTMTYLSNLDQPPDGTNAVGSDSWLAEMFRTGTNSSGYMLDSIQLELANASGTPSNFTVMLYSALIGGPGINPGTNLDTLNGSLNPVFGGTFTYTPTSNLALSPNTLYYVVLTAGTPVANGAYQWNSMNTASYNPNDNWGGGLTFISADGSSWARLGSNPYYDYSQFAINATAIPEPGVLGLFALSGLAFLWHRRNTSPRENRD